MDTSAKRKWVIAAVILLVAAALGAACMNVWQDRSFQNKGKGYVVVIRIRWSYLRRCRVRICAE